MSRKELSCLPVSHYPDMNEGKLTIPQWSKEAQAIGFDRYDLGEGSIAFQTLEELKKIREDCVLPLHMLSIYTDFTNSDADIRKKEVVLAQEKIRKTAALGGKYIRIPGGPAYPEAVEHEADAIEWMTECFNACIPVAKECGVRIVFENDSQPPSWKVPNFGFDVNRFVKTWESLKQLDIGFNFDTGNAFFLEDWKTILGTVIDRIETVHITDYDYRPGELNMTIFGQGTVPIEEMLVMIRDHGFSGKVITMEDTTFQGLKGTASSYRYTRSVCDRVFRK